MYRILAYVLANGRSSYLSIVFHCEESAYALADYLNDREGNRGVAYAPIRVK